MVKLVADKIAPRLPDNVELGIEMHYDAEVDDNNAAAVADALVDSGLYLTMVTPGACSHLAYGEMPPSCVCFVEWGSSALNLTPTVSWHPNAEVIFTANGATFLTIVGYSKAVTEAQAANGKIKIELDILPHKAPQIKLAEHRTCFFAFDYKIEENYKLLEWLQQYFLKPELGVRVIAPATEMEHLNIIRGLRKTLQTVHFGIAEITGNNLNVLYEAGMLNGLGKPLILLRQRDSKDKIPFDIYSDYRIEYVLEKWGGKLKFVWLEEELNKAMKAVFKMLPELKQTSEWSEKSA